MKELFELYPSIKQVYITSDGGVHLDIQAARAQAKHLEDATIVTQKRPKK